jgi:hypothetical protein
MIFLSGLVWSYLFNDAWEHEFLSTQQSTLGMESIFVVWQMNFYGSNKFGHKYLWIQLKNQYDLKIELLLLRLKDAYGHTMYPTKTQ